MLIVGLSDEWSSHVPSLDMQMSSVFKGTGSGILSALIRNRIDKNPSPAVRLDRYEKRINFVYGVWGYL